MVTSLFRHERIRTTKAKALEIRRSAEKLITRAKVDSVHNRRIVSGRLYDEGMVAKLFTDIAPRMKERPGGYTRILKLGERYGDAAEVVILELVDYKLETGKGEGKKDKKGIGADTGKP
jgi:large subunit ribosomal protein L17